MGREAQVHEKTNKRGTWAYHLVDGWYLFTSPELYRAHNCHIKHTKSEQLSDTVQLQHKRITNPSITHAKKVMHTLAECVKAIQAMTGKARNSQAAQDLQCIIDATQAQVQKNPHKFEETITRAIFATLNKFQGCRHQQVFPYTIPVTTDVSRAPCNRRHRF